MVRERRRVDRARARDPVPPEHIRRERNAVRGGEVIRAGVQRIRAAVMLRTLLPCMGTAKRTAAGAALR